MRKSFSCFPIAALLIAGSAFAQTAPPDTSRIAPPTPPDSSRNAQHCTTTGLSADTTTTCPDDMLKMSPSPGTPQVIIAPAGGATGMGGSATPAPATGASGMGPASMPGNVGGATRAAPGK